MVIPFFVLRWEPFVGFMPEDMMDWLKNHTEDGDLALAMAETDRQVGFLMHEVGVGEDPWRDEAYDRWTDVRKHIRNEIIARMRSSNEAGQTHYDLTLKGGHYIIKPFMEVNGFRDGNSWWIPANS